jgi:hypothetical protein
MVSSTQNRRGVASERQIPNVRNNGRCSKFITVVFLVFALLQNYALLIRWNAFDSYYSPSPSAFAGRDVRHMNASRSWEISPYDPRGQAQFSPFQFFHKIQSHSVNQRLVNCNLQCPASEIEEIYQLSDEQAEEGSFYDVLNDPDQFTTSSNSGTTGSKVINDRLERPIGIMKRGFHLGDFVARRLTASSHTISCPATVKVYLGPNCFEGSITEYIPHLEGSEFSLIPRFSPLRFEGVSTASLQSAAALDLLIDDRDRHGGNVLITPDLRLASIDHDNSLELRNDFVSLIRSGTPQNLECRSILNRSFWMNSQIVDRLRVPLDAETKKWISSLDIRKTIGTLDSPLTDFLQTRLVVLQAAIQQGISLPDLYSYMTPHFYSMNDPLHDWDWHVETIHDDYIAAMKFVSRSFADLSAQSDESIRASFHHYFTQIATLRMQVLSGEMAIDHFRQILETSLKNVIAV